MPNLNTFNPIDAPYNYRTIVYVSDSTGVTAETLGHSVLTQFEGMNLRQQRIPFVDNEDKAHDAVLKINDITRTEGRKAIVFTTLVNPIINAIVKCANGFHLDLFQSFVEPLEREFAIKSIYSVGRSHSTADAKQYKDRIEAINYSLAHDDGQSHAHLDQADIILVGVSRSGKTPTSLYLAMQYGLKAANYPLIPEDFERNVLPPHLIKHKHKLFGLTITPERLAEVRHERRPNSHYAALNNCRYEVQAAESMMRSHGIQWLSSTTKSIEEISVQILTILNIDKRIY
jgi:[pyruvate, water dikinase]-phosphate phosphotransferase / [pyruvate, water dikinase] kinase